MEPQVVYSSLVNGVSELSFDHPAVPCELLLVGPETVPICVNKSGQVLIAASRFGKGRVVVLGHEEYLNNPSFKQLLRNAVAWVTRDKQNAVVGIQESLTNLKQFLEESSHTVKCVSCVSPSLDAYCRVAYDGHHAEEVSQFVKSGGGLVIGGQACHWAQTSPGRDVLAEFAGNVIIGPTGIYFTDQYGGKGILKIPREMPLSAVCVHNRNIVTNQNDLRSLLEGVDEFQLSSNAVPSTLLVHGQLAFPVAQDQKGRTFIAAAHYGRGRVVVASHEAYLSHQPLKRFTTNAINWLRQGRPEKEVCVHNKLQNLLQTMDKEMKCKMSSCLDGHEAVYCCGASDVAKAEEVVQFVAEGGGLLIGGQSWSWAQTNASQEPLACYPGNKYLNHFGIAICPLTMKGGTTYKASNAVDTSKLYHFRHELSRLVEESSRSNLHQAFKNINCADAFVEDCSSYVRVGAHQNAQYGTIKQTLSRFVSTEKLPKPSEKSPIKHSEEKFLMQLAEDLFNITFCGGKPTPNLDSPPQRVSVNGVNKAAAAAWRSTGLYVLPQTEVTVTVPVSVTGKSWQLQVGCQTDDLSGSEQLKRPPRVTRRFAVTEEEVTVSSLFGGLLYMVVPGHSDTGLVEVTVRDAVGAPYFQAGKTSTEEWLSTQRSLPAPWAELETEAMILSVPSEWVRALDAPELLMQLWDRIMDGVFELAGTRLLRPERIVADVQIKMGSMHSGYPVMMHQKNIPDILDLEKMSKKGCWGPIHELGHNQQRNQWEFRPHTTEATCNLWAVYIHETVLGIPRHEAHGQLTEAKRRKRAHDYVTSGAQLSDWRIWTCLETYLQLQEGFGWKPFPIVFKSYLKMSCKDWTNQKKMTKWAEKFSLEVNTNLMPFFQAWGWSIDSPVEANVSKLPEWRDNPMTALL